jgi:hypothetical protein
MARECTGAEHFTTGIFTSLTVVLARAGRAVAVSRAVANATVFIRSFLLWADMNRVNRSAPEHVNDTCDAVCGCREEEWAAASLPESGRRGAN